jgi:hypothetical protein
MSLFMSLYGNWFDPHKIEEFTDWYITAMKIEQSSQMYSYLHWNVTNVEVEKGYVWCCNMNNIMKEKKRFYDRSTNILQALLYIKIQFYKSWLS